MYQWMCSTSSWYPPNLALSFELHTAKFATSDDNYEEFISKNKTQKQASLLYSHIELTVVPSYVNV
jgi:hypothetical protein